MTNTSPVSPLLTVTHLGTFLYEVHDQYNELVMCNEGYDRVAPDKSLAMDMVDAYNTLPSIKEENARLREALREIAALPTNGSRRTEFDDGYYLANGTCAGIASQALNPSGEGGGE